MKKSIYLIAFLFFCADAFAQCTLNVSANKDTIICGKPVQLSAFGVAAIPVLNENFDAQAFGPGWSGTTQAQWTNPCSPNGVDGTPHLWMGDAATFPRVVTTAAFDLSGCTNAGVSICFDMLYATQGGNSPCEGPDLPSEGVYLQYSTNGTTWVTINYFDPVDGYDPDLTNWKNWCFAVPNVALTATTRFRWNQADASEAVNDHWGLDNVIVYCNDPSYNIVWQHDGYNAGPTGGVHPTLQAPQTTTTYTATMSNGTQSCTDAVTVAVINPVLILDAGNDTTVCTGTCAVLGATAKVLESPAKTPTYVSNETAEIQGTPGFPGIPPFFPPMQGYVEVLMELNISDLNMTTILPNSITGVCIQNVTMAPFTPTTDLRLLSIKLICPDGDSITLVPSNTTTGNNYTNTCFVPAGGQNIATATSPYTGSYNPSQPFNNLVGCSANGVWTLKLMGSYSETTIPLGSMSGWSISFNDPELSYPGDFTWAPLTNMTGATTLTPSVCPTGPTAYTITMQDTAGCVTLSDIVNVDTQTCCNYTLGVAVTQPTCGQSNGSITITPTPAGTYQYAWAGGATTPGRTNLAAGTYSVTVTDVVNNCVRDTTITLNSNSTLLANINIIAQPTCAGNDGSVSLTLTGGTAPYNITIDTGGAPINITSPFPIPAPGQTLSNLDPMTVNVTVTDAQSCVVTATATLVAPANCCAFTAITATLVQPTCGQNNGSITITGGDGSGTYTYNWSGGLGSAAGISNLSAGAYAVTVTDGSPSCTVDTAFNLNSNSTLNISLDNPLNPTCAGNDGSIDVTLSGGTAPYSITIDTGGTPFTINSPVAFQQTLSNLGAMTISVSVTDGQSCTSADNVVLTAPTNCCTFTVSAAIVQPACGATDGSITLTTANGSGNYTYNWANGSGTGTTATNLGAGNYNVTVTDVGFANCLIDTVFSLSNPNAPLIDNVAVINETCPASADGSATVTASGGTGTLTYQWAGGETTPALTNLTAGTYNFTVSDANGCQAPGSAVITSGFCCTLTASAAAVPPGCGQTTGTITVTVTAAGVTPYEYSIDGLTYVSTATFSNVTAGTYDVYTRDANGCADTVQVTMAAGGADLNVTATPTNVTCNGAADGEIAAVSNNGTAPFTYLWNTNPAQTTATVTGLVAGGYAVTVIDVAGCTGTASATVTEPAALTIDLGADILVCEGDTVILTGAPGFASYTWSSGGNTMSISPVMSGPYTLIVLDANGCTASDVVEVTFIPTPVLNLGDDKLVYEGDRVALFSGVANANQNSVYNWQPGEYLTCTSCANTVALAVDTITYLLTYTDENGCTASEDIVLNVLPVVELYWPNAFSPNGDGNNELFLPYGNNVKLIDWKIFNRWGEKVFQSTNFFQGWDGTYKGVPQAPQLFTYQANVTMMNNSTKQFKGSFMLIR